MKEMGSYLRSKILKPGKWRSKVPIIDEPFRLVQKNWRNPSISSFGGGLKWGHGVKFMPKILPRYIFLYRRLIWKMITNSKRKMPEFCYFIIVFHQKWFFLCFFHQNCMGVKTPIRINRVKIWVSEHRLGLGMYIFTVYTACILHVKNMLPKIIVLQ